MLRLTSRVPGGPETLVLEETPDPVPAPGEVVVRVAACGVNFPDTLIIEDRYQYRPARPFAPGAEIAGIVEALGEGVRALAPGDRVMAMPGWNGMAERIALPAAQCVKMPDAMPFEHGAAFIMTYGTALHALRQRAALKAGETVLVLGAAGGVGLSAVEIAAALGGRVIAGASSEAKLAVAREHGAADGFVYPRGSLDKAGRRAVADRIKALCPNGADIVVDPVGGDLTEPAVRALGWNGRLLIVGFPAGIPSIAANLLLLKGASAIGVFYGQFTTAEREADAANMAELLALYAAGKLRPHVSARYPLADGGAAIAALSAQATFGKIVVEMSPLDRGAD